MTDNAFFGYILYSAVTLRLINQKELTCRPPVYTELTVSMTFLNYEGSFGAWPQPQPHPGLALSERRESEGDPGVRQEKEGQAERLGV